MFLPEDITPVNHYNFTRHEYVEAMRLLSRISCPKRAVEIWIWIQETQL
jgi:hypothetical protein